MPSPIERVKAALSALKQGQMIILTDHPDRENEGDLIMAAEKITPQAMNFIIRHTSGIVCLSMAPDYIKRLHLPLMVPLAENTSFRGTPFTISIDAKNNITTGVSAADRTQTVLAAIADEATADDIVRPGHIFPLQAKAGGVLERDGHTEGAVDLAHLAGLKRAAVLCEVMNEDGTMAHGKQLVEFAEKHQLLMLSIDDIITYRLHHENILEDHAETSLPLENYGVFKATVYKEKISGNEHIVLKKTIASTTQPILVRVHSACTTGDLFSSQRCDCNNELHYALQKISEEGGILIYLNQEGRGIGLFNKIKAYALQDQGYDTVEANEKLGFAADSRQYFVAAEILRREKITHLRLLTNNPAKISDLEKYGIMQVEHESMPIFANVHNRNYLATKKLKLNHLISLSPGN